MKDRQTTTQAHEGVISIVGSGMKIVGDCECEGTLRIEGRVQGTVRAAKAVVVGKDGTVDGDILTQDAVIGGRVTGTIVAESRLELQATCSIDGEIRARRIQLEEGGKVNGKVFTGDVEKSPQAKSAPPPQLEASRERGTLPPAQGASRGAAPTP